jgi:cytochrome b6-f complex iron-sulfur subunit
VFSAAGWGAVFVAVMTGLMGFMRYMFPRVLFEPPTTFRAGFPTEYALSAVNEKFKKDQRVWIVRQENGSFFALSAICTHLGCTPNWFATDNKYQLRTTGATPPGSLQNQLRYGGASHRRQGCGVSHGTWAFPG